MLTVKGLTKRFGKKVVLNDLEMSLKGHVYGLLGPNGSGKTTLLRCLTRIYPDGMKTIAYKGTPIGEAKSYLAQVGYLPQQFGLFKELSVKNALMLLGNLRGLSKGFLEKQIEQCLSIVNLSDRLNSQVGTLSGGMIRRLGIAQALLANPEIIFFDEPTAGLDPEERLRFKNLITEIKRDRLIIISTHIVEDVDAACERVLIMKDGKIAMDVPNQDVRDIVRNRVYVLPEKELATIQGSYRVFKKYDLNGQIMNRLLTHEVQNHLKAETPTIEDGYLWVITEP